MILRKSVLCVFTTGPCPETLLTPWVPHPTPSPPQPPNPPSSPTSSKSNNGVRHAVVHPRPPRRCAQSHGPRIDTPNWFKSQTHLRNQNAQVYGTTAPSHMPSQWSVLSDFWYMNSSLAQGWQIYRSQEIIDNNPDTSSIVYITSKIRTPSFSYSCLLTCVYTSRN